MYKLNTLLDFVEFGKHFWILIALIKQMGALQ